MNTDLQFLIAVHAISPHATLCPIDLRLRKNKYLVIPMKWKDWVHVTKLDPDKQLKPGDIDAIAASGTDALMLSGTLNVTQENLSALQKQVKAYGLPLVMEPAGPDAVLTRGVDYIFVPSVINSADVQWVVGKHRAWVEASEGKNTLGFHCARGIHCPQSGIFGRETDTILQ